MGYLANFIVYTLAMVGVIVVALLVFKSSVSTCRESSSKHLKVLDTLSLGQRKTLYIVSAGKEKFLIAGDTDKTSLISKLDSYEEEAFQIRNNNQKNHSTFDKLKTCVEKFSQKNNNTNLPNISRTEFGFNQNISNTNTIRNIAERIR